MDRQQKRRLAAGRVLHRVVPVGHDLLIRQEEPSRRRVRPSKLLPGRPDRRDIMLYGLVPAEDDDRPEPPTPHRLVDIEQQVVEGLRRQPEHVARHVVALPALDAVGQVAAVRQIQSPAAKTLTACALGASSSTAACSPCHSSVPSGR